jgi:hypothetical protein
VFVGELEARQPSLVLWNEGISVSWFWLSALDNGGPHAEQGHSLPRGARLTKAMGTGSCGSSMRTGLKTPAFGRVSLSVPEILVPVSSISSASVSLSEELTQVLGDGLYVCVILVQSLGLVLIRLIPYRAPLPQLGRLVRWAMVLRDGLSGLFRRAFQVGLIGKHRMVRPEGVIPLHWCFGIRQRAGHEGKQWFHWLRPGDERHVVKGLHDRALWSAQHRSGSK